MLVIMQNLRNYSECVYDIVIIAILWIYIKWVYFGLISMLFSSNSNLGGVSKEKRTLYSSPLYLANINSLNNNNWLSQGFGLCNSLYNPLVLIPINLAKFVTSLFFWSAFNISWLLILWPLLNSCSYLTPYFMNFCSLLQA